MAKTWISSRLPALTLLAAILAAPARAPADDLIPGNDYVSALAGYFFAPKELGTTGSGDTIAAIYGHQFATHFSVEGNVQTSILEAGASHGTNFYQTGATADLVYALFDRRFDPPVTPYVLAGIGGADDDWHPNDRGPVFLAEAGLGAVTRPFFSDAIRFRLDGRWVHDSKDGGHGEPRVLLGIEIPLGRTVRHVEYLKERETQPPRGDAH
jgi:OmpA-OmpF porin, OOP family